MENILQMGELKKRALLAKKRMSMGYWRAVEEEHSAKLTSASSKDASSITKARMLQREKVLREDKLALGVEEEIKDEQLYKKVCLLLEEDEDIINPIGRLVDRDAVSNMDDGNRQRYILKLSQKFREMKERFYRERTCVNLG